MRQFLVCLFLLFVIVVAVGYSCYTLKHDSNQSSTIAGSTELAPKTIPLSALEGQIDFRVLDNNKVQILTISEQLGKKRVLTPCQIKKANDPRGMSISSYPPEWIVNTGTKQIYVVSLEKGKPKAKAALDLTITWDTDDPMIIKSLIRFDKHGKGQITVGLDPSTKTYKVGKWGRWKR